jgi:hypothetical protein
MGKKSPIAYRTSVEKDEQLKTTKQNTAGKFNIYKGY